MGTIYVFNLSIISIIIIFIIIQLKYATANSTLTNGAHVYLEISKNRSDLPFWIISLNWRGHKEFDQFESLNQLGHCRQG